MSVVEVASADDILALETRVRAAAEVTRSVIGSFRGDGLALLHMLKFTPCGRHPLDNRALNAVEQLNQTFSALVCLSATRWLLEAHPDAEGFILKIGATAGIDIESRVPGLVGAEGFAAVTPKSNAKLQKDCEKMMKAMFRHRYVFFHSPGYEAGEIAAPRGVQGVRVRAVMI